MVRRKISDEELTKAVLENTSMYGVLTALGLKQAGGSFSHYKRRIDALGISIAHFKGRGWASGMKPPNRLSKEEILVLRESGRRAKAQHLVRALLESGIPHCCSKCGQPPKWLGNPLTLDVDHINENWLDDRIDNLRFLCPNCHSQFSRKLLPS